MKKLTSSFLEDIFKLGFVKRSFLETMKNHLLFSYIPKELPEYKVILKSMISQYEFTAKLPSYGVISQQYQHDPNVQNALSKIKNADIIDVNLAVKELQEYIIDIKFQLLFDDVYEKYVKDKKDEAMSTFIKGAEELGSFSLKADGIDFMKVFGDYKTVLKEKQLSKEAGDSIPSKVPFGIDAIDSITEGGMDLGDTAMWIMPSGRGKSTVLKWTGMYACRMGYDVLHFQLEGSRQEAYDKYSQIWTGEPYKNIKWGDISRDKLMKIETVIREMSRKKRDINIYSFEKYGSASMKDIREMVIEYNKINGRFPHLIIIDSLDLAISGDNKKIDFDPAYKKERLQSVALRMKDMAVEFNTRVLTATQTGNISKEKWNNPDWVITRENTEGDRTLVKPFSHVFTGNTTEDEFKNNMARVYIDKLRYYDPKDMVYPICTAFNFGKYYDRNRTLKEFSHIYENR